MTGGGRGRPEIPRGIRVSGSMGVAPAAAGWGRGWIELTTTVWKQSETAYLGVESTGMFRLGVGNRKSVFLLGGWRARSFGQGLWERMTTVWKQLATAEVGVEG